MTLGLFCKHCRKENHDMLNCKHLGDGKCSICRKFGHTSDRYWERNIGKMKNGKGDCDNGKNWKKKKKKIKEVEEDNDDNELIGMNIEWAHSLSTLQEGGTSASVYEDDDGWWFNYWWRIKKTDCEIQAKQAVKPFNRTLDKKSKPRELHRNQYYILFIDNTTRYATVDFLKWKDEVAQHVKNYLKKLKTHSKPPITIRIDQRKEF